MKVGTDAVLLGAWCPVTGAKRILDIGTGCGVIALMLAQRSQPDAHIDAVELQAEDARQAQDNVRMSPWPEKVKVHQASIQEFQSDPYDLIVCNPPFFTQSLQPPDPRRARVRHDNELPREVLIEAASRLLAPDGSFSVILPAEDTPSFIAAAAVAGLHVQRHTRFHTRRSKPAERSLLSVTRKRTTVQTHDLVLYENDRHQTEEYRNLTGAFYL